MEAGVAEEAVEEDRTGQDRGSGQLVKCGWHWHRGCQAAPRTAGGNTPQPTNPGAEQPVKPNATPQIEPVSKAASIKDDWARPA